MAEKVAQPTQNPTRKLSAAVIATATVAIGKVIVEAIWPGTTDDDFWMAMFPVAAYAAGYFVKDEATVTMVQNVIEKEVEVK